jgi:hypothetical protein
MNIMNGSVTVSEDSSVHNPQYLPTAIGLVPPLIRNFRHSIKSPCSDFTVYQLPVDLYTSPVIFIIYDIRRPICL